MSHKLLRARLWVLLALLLVSAAGTPQSGTAAVNYFCVILNATNAPHATAQLDVSVDTSFGPGIAVTFIVFDPNTGVPITTFVVLTNANGFASSAMAPAPTPNNLFTISGGRSALVQAGVNIPTGTELPNAVLRQSVQGAKIILGVPPDRRANGTALSVGSLVSVAVGDLMQGTSLIIANVSGSPAAVSVFLGTAAGAPQFSNPNVPPNTIWNLALQASDANSNVVVSSTGNVIIQLAIDDGKVDEATLLPS